MKYIKLDEFNNHQMLDVYVIDKDTNEIVEYSQGLTFTEANKKIDEYIVKYEIDSYIKGHSYDENENVVDTEVVTIEEYLQYN